MAQLTVVIVSVQCRYRGPLELLENGRQRSLGRDSQPYSGRENGYWHPGGEISRRLSAVRDTLRELCSALPAHS